MRTIIQKIKSKFRFENLSKKSESTHRSGRLCFTPIDYDYPGSIVEWSFDWPPKHYVLSFTVDPDENEIKFYNAILPLHFSVKFVRIRSLLKKLNLIGPWQEFGFNGYKKDIRISFHDGILFWTLWLDMDNYSHRMPKHRCGSFDVVSAVLGDENKRVEKIIGPISINIPMPEKKYKGTLVFTCNTWHRERLPSRTMQNIIAEINMDEPIPIPGKGTLPHNIAEDKEYAACFQVDSLNVEEAINRMTEGILEHRIKYGSLDWKPTNN